ncbi:hypothetical protein WG906_08910 [Pedobacter sp. P351]
MTASTSTIVIEKLIDLELVYKLKADLLKFRRKKTSVINKSEGSKAA